ncbi:MAG: hypothetical protein HYU39_05750 [Thaumarchaeota archaeon]|nr:hypothetical protein [Nitrososphaerota archaeon]
MTGTIDVTKLTGTIISLAGASLQLGALTITSAGAITTIDEGQTVTYTVTATYTDGSPASSVTIKILRDNAQIATATTGIAGTATITLTFDQPGTYIISATGDLTGIQKSTLTSTVVVISKRVTAALTIEKTKLQPGSSLKVTLNLNSTKLLEQGTVTITLPQSFTAKNVQTTGFQGTATIQNNILTIQKTTATTSTSQATITFTLSSPIKGIKIGQAITVTATVDVLGLRTVFSTDSTFQITIEKPSANSVFSVLDSYFAKTVSALTEDRVPTVADIFALLDLYFGA